MNRVVGISELLQRIEFLEAAVKELNPGLIFPFPPSNFGIPSLASLMERGQDVIPRDPTPAERDPIITSGIQEAREDQKRKLKYLVFSETVGQAYDWSIRQMIGSLDWIRIQGTIDEHHFIYRLYSAKTHRFRVIQIGNWKTEEMEEGLQLLLEDGIVTYNDIYVFSPLSGKGYAPRDELF